MTAGTILGFVGVSTAGSSIQRVFPAWADVLGLDGAHLVGHDLPLDAGREAYRAVVRQIRDNPEYAGALITTHKIGVYQAASDLFGRVDEFGRLCGEISSVSKREGELVGHAKDPLTAGLSLEEILAGDHFSRTGGNALIMGAGGAGTAIAWCLAGRSDPPRRIVCTGLDESSLRHLCAVVERHGTGELPLETHVVDGRADALLTEQPAGTLVVNATGMGKDRPGSPVGEYTSFPQDCVAWELNYRGSVEFWHQAARAGARVHDGWRYFLHGWSQVIAEIFGLGLTREDVDRLALAAEAVR